MEKLGILFIVIILPVLTISCVTKEVQVTETYYETEYRIEQYIEAGEEHQRYITPKWERYPPIYFTELEWAKAGAESSIGGYEISKEKLSEIKLKLVLSKDPQSSLWQIVILNLTGTGSISEPPPQIGFTEMVEREMKYIPSTAEQQWLENINVMINDPKHLLFAARSEQYSSQEIIIDVSGVEELAIITCTPPHWWVSSSPVIEKVLLMWSDDIIRERQVPYEVEKQRIVTQTEKVPFWETFETNP